MAHIEGAGHHDSTIVASNTAVAQQTPATTPTPEETAEQILDVGKRSFLGVDGLAGDNYQDRAAAYADVVGQADKAFREEVLTEILERDPNALNSWLSPEVINQGVEAGTISRHERAQMAETFAALYNDGHFDTYELPAHSQGFGVDRIEVTEVDNPILSITDGGGLGGADQALLESERIAQFAEFIDAGYGPETAEFRENYSEHLIETYVLNDQVDNSRQNMAAALSAELMSGDHRRPEIAVNVLSGLSSAERTEFIDQVASGSAAFNRDFLERRVELNPQFELNDLTMRDGVAAIYSSVANSRSPAATELAVDLARNTDRFVSNGDNGGLQDRVRQFGRMTLSHSDAILDELTAYDRSNVSTVDNSDLEQYEVNAQDLAEVLELTAFNDQSPYQTLIQNQVLDYAAAQTDAINNATDPDNTGFNDAAGRLSVLSAASSHVVTESFDQIAADREARQALIGFAVDLALAAVPLGNLANSQAKSALAELLPEGHIRTAVEGLTGQIINSANGQLTNAAKEQLYATLDNDEAAAVIQRELQDTLEAAFTAGIDNEVQQNLVEERADRLADDLAD